MSTAHSSPGSPRTLAELADDRRGAREEEAKTESPSEEVAGNTTVPPKQKVLRMRFLMKAFVAGLLATGAMGRVMLNESKQNDQQFGHQYFTLDENGEVIIVALTTREEEQSYARTRWAILGSANRLLELLQRSVEQQWEPEGEAAFSEVLAEAGKLREMIQHATGKELQILRLSGMEKAVDEILADSARAPSHRETLKKAVVIATDPTNEIDQKTIHQEALKNNNRIHAFGVDFN
ncbi:hypothetical protein A2880_02165 [Candidatus Peribacteria bacterium RIFCSPHIGHO2_01_FULL_49_38]|nr:MAG: hypothetical protein A2880_02165 [Candidatus Peribacteria bacterium RIFCSPHIGHO2_01_FULL_49_38]